eukprot:CAMPEP_0117665158 /NCGR_PEP_ID=MMETSP0804-20121206/9650_1 /TAXON_ID=1074897 /ORGANISM="Tetraselmis astigmatica, Strain CCMP880" /LENGTH=216 /DNA_ID=CAMNT_0005472531 /DNA_START=95 /DNA_END=742 /DNA_ORIENTATION=-
MACNTVLKTFALVRGGSAAPRTSTTRPSQLGRGPAARPRANQMSLFASRGTAPITVAMVEAPTSESPLLLRKFLLEKGWSSSWVDGIVEQAKKNKFQTSTAKAGEVVQALTGLGFRGPDVENICSRAPAVLGRSVNELMAVKDYMIAQGATEEEIRGLILKTPRVLLYDPVPGGKQLALGKARMELDVTTRGDKRLPVLTLYREGSVFESAPVSPW